MSLCRSHIFHQSSIDVVEKRAPTDESIRLLREMEKEVLSKITNNITLKNNEFSARLLVSTDNLNLQKLGLILFSLNGRRHEIRFAFDSFEDTEESMVNRCLSELSKYLATEILKSVSKFE